MKKSILVTAVAGSGKSTVCKALTALGRDAVDIEALPNLFELVHEETGKPMPHGWNSHELIKQVDWNCKKDNMRRIIASQKSELTFYCGAMSNFREVWDLFDGVIVLTVSDETTVKRLSTRKPGQFGHMAKTRQWVLSWKRELEDEWLAMGAIAVSGEPEPTAVAKAIIETCS